MARAFAYIGILLLLSTFWGLWADHNREWKGYQKTFRRLVVEKTQGELIEARERLEGPELEKAEEELETALAFQKENKADYQEAQRVFKGARHTFFKADRKRQFIKSRLEAALYRYDHAVKTGHGGDKEYQEVEALRAELADAAQRSQGLERIQDQEAERLAHYEAPVEGARRKIERLESDAQRLEKRISQNRSRVPVFTQGLEIKQFNLEELGRVDRCMTCHLGVEKSGFENAEQPFTTHPNGEFLLANHPVETFGCTVCHGGQGRATDKERAHGFVEFWYEPLLERQFVETSCLKCHNQVTQLEGAPVVMEGRQLFEQYGCWACHQVEGFEPLEDRLVGPDLVRVGSVTNKEWLKKWITDPKKTRPKTRMPTFRFEEGEVESIAAYLMSLKDDAVNGEYDEHEQTFGHKPSLVEEGRELVADLNCIGCHTIKGEGDRFGPELSAIGDMARPGWMFQWLKDPRGIQPHTLMPNFRLTDREAYTITEYLSTLKGEAGVASGAVSEGPASSELIEHGRDIIAAKGCLACHKVGGIEQKLIIPPLTGLADKRIHELDFGYTQSEEVPRTVKNWVRTKIKTPALFETERVTANMPTFNLEEDQVEALLTYLMTLTEYGPPEEFHHALTETEQQIELGRRIVREHNCTACHKIEGVGSEVAPDLTGEGRKVQQQWLFSFLKEPTTLRPWLKARMPNFGFEDEEAGALVAYFAALDEEPYPFESFETAPPAPEELAAGKELFEMFKCLSCHVTGGVPEGVPTDNLAPDLTQVKQRLKPEWLISWIKDPQSVQPGTRMPTNWPFIMGRYFIPPPAKDILGGDVDRQIRAVRDYLLVLEGEEKTEEEEAPLMESVPQVSETIDQLKETSS